MKKTIIINYPNLSAGGIESALSSLISYCLDSKYRVIWITNSYYLSRVAYNGIINNEKLEIILHDHFKRLFSYPKINFERDECVVMITCRAAQFLVSERIKEKSQSNTFTSYLIIAHYTGNTYYPDRWFHLLHKKIYDFYRQMLIRIINNHCLRAFSLKHLENYEEYYKVDLNNKASLILPRFDSPPVFDHFNSKRRAEERNHRFVITTCARFEFPHKGYILGLIETFAMIKELCSYAVLQIVGYGEKEQDVRSKIDTLDEEIKRDIILIGMVSKQELKRIYKESNLCIGLAGSISLAAYCGIPALVVRHYTNACETYGFYDVAYDKTLCDEPGKNIMPYIKRALSMSNDEYEVLARKQYDIISTEDPKTNPEYFFEQTESKTDLVVRSKKERIIARLIFCYTELKEILLGLLRNKRELSNN